MLDNYRTDPFPEWNVPRDLKRERRGERGGERERESYMQSRMIPLQFPTRKDHGRIRLMYSLQTVVGGAGIIGSTVTTSRTQTQTGTRTTGGQNRKLASHKLNSVPGRLPLIAQLHSQQMLLPTLPRALSVQQGLVRESGERFVL